MGGGRGGATNEVPSLDAQAVRASGRLMVLGLTMPPTLVAVAGEVIE